jgi:hypothetical protein
MTGETHNGMQCNEFEALLFDALDHRLGSAADARFRAHARTCTKCGAMFTEIEAGQRWMKTLDQVEPPANLVHNILAATSGLPSYRLQESPAARQPSLGERVGQWLDSLWGPVWVTVRQPRFAMSFGTAFFTLSVALSVAGFRPDQITRADLSRNGLRRAYYTTQARVVKYYENIRLVYEIESRVQELKKVARPVERKNDQERERDRKNNSNGQPEPRQERNYSRGENQPVLASAPEDPPAVPVTTFRRLV